jgi:hypothetical protein
MRWREDAMTFSEANATAERWSWQVCYCPHLAKCMSSDQEIVLESCLRGCNDPPSVARDLCRLPNIKVKWIVSRFQIMLSSPKTTYRAGLPQKESEIAPFEFDGNLNSLLSYLNQRVPGLSAMSGTETAQIYEVQYHFKFDSNTTVRDVLCALTRDYGVRWNADIERTVPVQRLADHIDESG